MNHIRKVLLSLSLATWSAIAAASSGPGDHNQVEPLPINGMVAAVKNGKLAFVSSNGRFVFQGSMFDSWEGKNIESLEDARHAYNYMNLKKLDFRVDALAPMTIGNGSREIVIFTDPYCPSCHLLIEDALKETDYTFKLVHIPVLGEDSQKAVRFGFCSPDRELAQKVLLGRVKPKDIPNTEFKDCDKSPVAKRVVTTQLLGLKGVPFLLRDDGLVRNGYMKGDLHKWLTEGI